MTCKSFHDFMQAQQSFLKKAIDENKWYLSEQAGRDVGLAPALDHFWQNHLDRVAHDFRMQYCQAECAERGSCDLGRRAGRLKSSRELHAQLEAVGKPG